MKRRLADLFAAMLTLHGAIAPAAFAQGVPTPGVQPVPVQGASPIGGSANGTPVLDIARPNDQGVSHNRFLSFDVDQRGLIINNSAIDAVSLIGGGTAANRNLAGGPGASLIINEVVAANAGSQLRGYQEILGTPAQLVIANPWGITCDGCGFVNTPRVTLTTGVPQFTGGALSGFTITGGQISVGEGGLDASRVSVLDLIARSVRINGGVFAGGAEPGLSGTIGAFGGGGSFDYALRTLAGAAGTGAPPEFAIDTSLLGGMYADRIALIVNETGAGVRHAGNMAALAEDLTIAASGRLEITGSATAARDISLSAGTVNIEQAAADGIVFAGRDLSAAAAGGITLGKGDIGARGNAAFTAGALADIGAGNRFAINGALSADAGSIALAATWSGPALSVRGSDIAIREGATLFASSAAATPLSITTARLLEIDGIVFANGNASLAADQVRNGTTGVLAAQGDLALTLGNGGLDNAGAIQSGMRVLVGNASLAPLVNRASGVLFAGTDLSIAAAPAFDNEGIAAAGGLLAIDTAAVTNRGTLQAGRLALGGGRLDNLGSDALIFATGSATGDASIAARAIVNEGTIFSAGDLALTPATIEQRRAAGATTSPFIGAANDLTLAFTGDAVLSAGTYQAGRDLKVSGARGLDTGGTDDLRIAGRDGTFTAASGGDLEIAGSGWITTRDLRLTGDSVRIGGFSGAGGTITDVPDVTVTGGAGGSGLLALAARSGSVDLRPGATVQSGGDLEFTQPAPLIFGPDRTLVASGTLTVRVPDFIVNSGVIAGDVLRLLPRGATPLQIENRAGGLLQGTNGLIIGTRDNPASFLLNNGFGQTDADPSGAAGTRGIIIGGNMQIFADSIENRGLIIAQGGDSLIDTPNFLNNSEVTARPDGFNGTVLSFFDSAGAGSLTIETRDFVNRGLFAGVGRTNINARTIVNEANAGLSGFDLRLNGTNSRYTTLPQSIVNFGDIFGGDVLLRAGTIVNGIDYALIGTRQPATIYAANDLTLDAFSDIFNFNDIGSGRDIIITGFANIFNGRGDLVRGGNCTDPASLTADTCFDTNLQIRPILGVPPLVQGEEFARLVGEPNTAGNESRTVSFEGRSNYHFRVNAIAFDETVLYADSTTTRAQDERLSGGGGTIRRPSLIAGRDLFVFGDSLTNRAGILGAGRDAFISAGALNNTGFDLFRRNITERVLSTTRCLDSALGASPVSCLAAISRIVQASSRALDPIISAPTLDIGDAAPSTIFAGRTLSFSGGPLVNGASVNPVQAPTATFRGNPGVSLLAPGTPGLRPGATGITAGGATFVLPGSPNGRFVIAQTNDNRPLIETNPAFGIDSPALGSEFLVRLLGLEPDEQARRLGDDNYEAYLITEQVKAQTNKSVLNGFADTYSMTAVLFDNAKTQAEDLGLTFGTALTVDQIGKLKSDIIWMVEQVVQGQTVLVPVVYLSDATRASVVGGSSLQGYNININNASVTNKGGDIVAMNLVNIKSATDIQNLSGRIAGANVLLDATGNVINETLTRRTGTAANGNDIAERVATIEATGSVAIKAGNDIRVTGAWINAGENAVLAAGRNVEIAGKVLTQNEDLPSGTGTMERQSAISAGVVAGNNLIVTAGQDVVTRGAILHADARNAQEEQLPLPESGDSFCQRNRCTDAEREARNTKRAEEIARREAAFAADPTGVLSIRAGRNVDIGTLALTDSRNSQSSSSDRYDTLDRDAENMQLTTGTGMQQTSESFESSSTRGIGSSLSGNRVQISTTSGDVDITGSNISSGSAGTIIDSARDVRITAFDATANERRNTSTDRQGVEIVGTMDGVSSNFTASGSRENSTQSSTIAQVSSLDSAGRIIVSAKGDIRNEGTQYTADDTIAFIGETLTNTTAANSASSTTSSTEYSTSAGIGMSAMGTGSSISNAIKTAQRNRNRGNTPPASSDAPNVTGLAGDPNQQAQAGQFTVGNPEIAVTVNASGSSGTASSSSTTVTTTNIRSGGDVVYRIEGSATDVGTQIKSDGAVDIAAGTYSNLAAANTFESQFSTTTASGQLKGSVNATLEAGANVDMSGSSDRGTTFQSQAVVGTVEGARGVSIRTSEGALKLQGTQVTAGVGGVVLDAKTDLQLDQATDTQRITGSGESGSARLGGSISLAGAGASGGGGASGRSYEYTDTTSAARTVDIKSGGNVVLRAGNDINAQGTNVDATGSVALDAGRDINFLASQSIRDIQGRSDGGGADLTLGGGSGSVSSGGGSVTYERNRVDYTRTERTGGTINAGGSVSVTAGRNADFEGTQIAAKDASIDVAGDFTMRSAQSTTVENTSLDSGRIEASGSRGGGMSGANSQAPQGSSGGNAGGGNIGINHSHSRQDILTNSNATLTTSGSTTLNIGNNATLAGARIDADGGVSGTIGGNLSIETRTDRAIVDQAKNSTYIGVAPVGGLSGDTGASRGVEITQAVGNHAGQTGLFVADTNVRKNNQTVNQASGISGGTVGIDVNVGGNTTLKGATNAGSDFKTTGTTTSTDVQTFVNESTSNTRITGTIASAAGSDQGRGGDFNFNPNVDAARSRPPVAAPGGQEPGGPPPLRVQQLPGDSAYSPLPAFDRPAAAADTPVIGSHRQPANPNLVPAPPPVRPNPGNDNGNVRNVASNLPDVANSQPGGNSYQNTVVLPKPNVVDQTRVFQNGRDNNNNNNNNSVVAQTGPGNGTQIALVIPQQNGGVQPNAYDDAGSQGLQPQRRQEPVSEMERGFDPNGPRQISGQGDNNLDSRVPFLLPGKDTIKPGSSDPSAALLLGPQDRRAGQVPDEMKQLIFSADGGVQREAQLIIGEIDRFAAGNADLRGQLLDQLTLSVKGPAPGPDGWTLHPLDPTYIGEDRVGFSSWLRRREDGAVNSNSPQVIYLTPEQQAASTVRVVNGRLIGPKGEDASTAAAVKTVIFVIDSNGNLILGEPSAGRFHHSSLAGGRPVRMAGELTFDVQGQVKAISNNSGHYKPSDAMLVSTIRALQDAGLNFTPDTTVLFSRPGGRNNWVDVNLSDEAELNRRAAPSSAFDQPKGPIGNFRPGEIGTAPDNYTSAANAFKGAKIPQESNYQALGNTLETASDRTGLRLVPPAQQTIIPGNQPGAPGSIKSEFTAFASNEARASEFRRLAMADELRAAGGEYALRADILSFNRYAVSNLERLAMVKTANALGNAPDSIRATLRQAFETSLRPPQEDSASGLIRLLPQYVGEHVPDLLPDAPVRGGKSAIYYSEAERDARVATLSDGRLLDRNGRPVANGIYAFVQDAAGRLVIERDETPGVFHSSLTAGGPVRMAGNFHVSDGGRIDGVDQGSGHYRPDLNSFITFLRANQANLGDASALIIVSRNVQGGLGKSLLRGDLDLLPMVRNNDGASLGRVEREITSVLNDGARRNAEQTQFDGRDGFLSLTGLSGLRARPAQDVAQLLDMIGKARLAPETQRELTDSIFAMNGSFAVREAELFKSGANVTEINNLRALRADLFDRMARGIEGAQGTGETRLFPLIARYVGEEVPGAFHWGQRSGSARGKDMAVSYLDEGARARQMARVEGGTLRFVSGETFGDGTYIFVVDRDGRIIVDRGADGRIHHSSLAGGDAVRFAGELVMSNGAITTITNKSGHYRPDEASFVRFLGQLKDAGFDSANVRAHVWTAEDDVSGTVQRNRNLFNEVRSIPRLGGGSAQPEPGGRNLPEAPKTAGGLPRFSGLEPNSPATDNAANNNNNNASNPGFAAAARSKTEGSFDEARIRRMVADRNLPEFVANNMLGEIDALRQKGQGELADKWMADFVDALEGPKEDPRGFRTFPIVAAYVGENDPANFTRSIALRQGGDVVSTSEGKVIYFTPEKQALHRIDVDNNQARWRTQGGGSGEPLSGKKIFVVMPDGEMIVGNPEFGVTQHSSLASGKRVRMAGEIDFDANGNITRISNKSGHYRVRDGDFVIWLQTALGATGKLSPEAEIFLEQSRNFGRREKLNLNHPDIKDMINDFVPSARPSESSVKDGKREVEDEQPGPRLSWRGPSTRSAMPRLATVILPLAA